MVEMGLNPRHIEHNWIFLVLVLLGHPWIIFLPLYSGHTNKYKYPKFGFPKAFKAIASRQPLTLISMGAIDKTC